MANKYYSPAEKAAAEELDMSVEELRLVVETYTNALARIAREKYRVLKTEKR